MVSITLEGGTVITMDPARRVLRDASVVTESGRIVDLGSTMEVRSRQKIDDVINCSGKIIMPGMINAHTHMFQSLLRGLGDDMELVTWLRRLLFPACKKLTDEQVRVGAALGSLEMAKTGVTTVIDNHHVRTSEKAVDGVAGAVLRTGLRGFIARGMKTMTKREEKLGVPKEFVEFDLQEDIAITERLIQRWRDKGEGRVSICPGPTSIHASGPDMLREVARISQRYSVPVHIHIAESNSLVQTTIEDYGVREVEVLHETGVLGGRCQVVHGIWLSEEEIQLLNRAGAHHVHCPVSNMYVASGVAQVPKMLSVGVNIALGTDGPAANNSHDMFSVLKFAVLLQKVTTLNPTIITSSQVLEMATMGGARALGLQEELGSIEVGKKADLVVVNLKRINSYPVYNEVSSLVYCASESNVESVMVDGKLVMHERKMVNVDEDQVLSEAGEVGRELAPIFMTC